MQYYGTFRRLNALSSLRTETRKKNMKHLGQPVISHLRIVLLFDLYLQKHSVLIPTWISLWKKPAWEQFVFKEKCQKSKIQYTMDVFVCTPKTYRSHAHLIFFLTGMKAACFWWKMSKIKNKLYYRCLFFFHFFWFLSPKHASLMHIWFFLLRKTCMRASCFWWKKPKTYQISVTTHGLFSPILPSFKCNQFLEVWYYVYHKYLPPQIPPLPPKRQLGTWLKTLFIILRRRLVEFLVFNSIYLKISGSA